MQFHDLDALVTLARKSTEQAFARAHPLPVFVFEPFATEHAEATDSSEETHDVYETSQGLRSSKRFRAALAIDLHARVCWIADANGEGPIVRLGRDQTCDFVLEHPGVSRQHAAVRHVGTAAGGAWLLDDLGSRNGTFLNGRELPRGKTHALASGDVICLGTAVTFRPFFAPLAFYRALLENGNAA